MTEKPEEKASRTYTPSQFIIMCLATAIFPPVIFMLLAGDWSWIEGWIFCIWLDAMMLSTIIYMYLRDPALLAERSRRPGSGNQKRWDTYLLVAVYLIALLWLAVLPLDARRFGWSPAFPIWLKVLGGLALIPALYFIFRATVINTFLSTMVRVQTERKQHVISTDVYGFVRHPLYLGCVLMMIGSPLLLGSLWGLIITGLGLMMLIVRINGEEKTLAEELDGYDEYKTKVKYRLVPFIW
jgi:protein-S-isoprenylcysteine O-methyltransferase Ste14